MPGVPVERVAPALFELSGVGREVDGRAVLRDLTFSIQPGERVVVLGVNGCGKTTLLKLLDGLDFPSAGTIRYDGARLTAQGLEGGAFRRRFRGEVALLFQNVDAMLLNPTVADEIAFGPRHLGLADPDERAVRWAEAFGVAHLLGRRPFELSGGEKKRVALAALLAIDPKVLLLDEATAGLDPASAARLLEILAGLPQTAVVATTHTISLAEELGTRALLLGAERGLLYDGSPAALLADRERLIDSGLAHRHVHRHRGTVHTHFHVHDMD